MERKVILLRVTLQALAPLMIASGEEDALHDVLLVRDPNDLPTIPATSIAGALRARIGDRHNDWFGSETPERRQRSAVTFTDGLFHWSDNLPRDGMVLGEARAVSGGSVPFTQATLNPIGSFLRIYDEAPYGTYSVTELTYNVTSDGADIVSPPDGLDTVYVDYKKRWDGPYNSTTNSLVPMEFFHYAAHGAFADFLRYDGQNEKAAAEEGYAESLLVLELEDVMNQRNFNTAGKRIRSHQTTQSRHSSTR